ncbi:unnamed protein product, partial [Arabidopsis lyrata]
LYLPFSPADDDKDGLKTQSPFNSTDEAERLRFSWWKLRELEREREGDNIRE